VNYSEAPDHLKSEPSTPSTDEEKLKKIETFKYILAKFTELGYSNLWHYNDCLSIIVSSKLLFVCCVASNGFGDVDPQEISLFRLFNYQHAFPWGPTEYDIFDSIKSVFDNGIEKTSIEFSYDTSRIDENVKKTIDLSIGKIEELLPELKSFKDSELIEYTHQYKTWKDNYKMALRKGVRSVRINNSDLLKERLLDYHCKEFFTPIAKLTEPRTIEDKI
jgi:hypothetical protein